MPHFGALALIVSTAGLASFVILDPFRVRAIHPSLYIAANVLGAVFVACVAWALLAASGIPWASQSEDIAAIPFIVALFTLGWIEFLAGMLVIFRTIERSGRQRP